MRSLVTHATQLLLAGAFLVLWGLSARRPGWRRWSSWWLAPLAIVALVTYLDFFRFHARGPTHYWEFYHYHLGTKYFRELGYGGLYEATVVADFEDDRGHFDPRAVIRSLTDYQGVYRGQVIRTAEIVTWAFSPSRWQEFKRDVAVYREANPIPWRSSRVQQDHGYNGSPLVTAVLGTLANQPWLSTRHFIAIFSWADVALLLATAAVIAWLVGPASAWLLVFLWALNPLNTYTMIGGAYLRSLHLVGLALALAGMQRGHQPAFGALLAVASLLRLFPGLLA
ncbi:MAG TPA: hypothetical protein VLD61_00715, partial [Methylomirabilota bacterium]|nr:hypothetical protein [Methylomirabilota bacterium]